MLEKNIIGVYIKIKMENGWIGKWMENEWIGKMENGWTGKWMILLCLVLERGGRTKLVHFN